MIKQKILKSGFTLLELLVVVLIIGILAAIALPQYNKAVLKSRLHTGIPLVESLYRAQQVYAIANGDYATDIDALDVKIPIDSSCQKSQTSKQSAYTCSFGIIGMYDNFSNVQFIIPGRIAYLHYLKDYNNSGNPRKAGKRFCFAKPKDSIAKDVCQNIGSTFSDADTSWARYKLN